MTSKQVDNKQKHMSNFEQATVEFIESLPVEKREKLIEIIEWEKELSWSDGYEQADEEAVALKK